MFSKEIEAKLKEKLNPENIKNRKQAGQSLDYLEGWYVQNLLNETFGHGGWSQSVKSITQVSGYEVEKKTDYGLKTNHVVAYQAVVSLTVFDKECTIVREDVGVGLGEGQNLSMIVEKAIKEAVTDGVKRAAKSLGDPFGLTLYDKDRAGVMNEEEVRRAEVLEKATTKIKTLEKELYDMLEQGKPVEQVKAWIEGLSESLLQGKAKFPELAGIIDGMLKLSEDYISIGAIVPKE